MFQVIMEDESKIVGELDGMMERKKDGDDDLFVHSVRPTQHNKTPMTFKAIISLAILSSPIKKATLAEIYQFIEDAFAEFTKTRTGWKNTVRHNLSIHECFVKGELAPPGKSCYWQIHKSYAESFSRGDFSRRQVRIVSKVKEGDRDKRGLSTRGGSRTEVIHRECHNIPSDVVRRQPAPRCPTQAFHKDEYAVYRAWRTREEERKRFIAEVSPFCERYYYDGNHLCVSLPHVVGYDEYVLPGRSFECAFKDYRD